MRRRRMLDPRVAAVTDSVPGEQLLAWGVLVTGDVAVCTTAALYAPDGGRLPWDRVVRAAWSEEFLDLVVQQVSGAPSEHRRLRFDDPGDVPAVVRERIEWTVLASQHVELGHPDGRSGGAVLTARRSPETGEARWSVVFDAGLDPADPQWRAAADAALAYVRAQLGV